MMGFDDKRGKLFYDIVRIARRHKPWMLFLENVGNLEGHDGGNTLKVIRGELEGLGYTVGHQVLNSSNFGVPQSRKRIYILAMADGMRPSFPSPTNAPVSLKDVLLPPDQTVGQEIDAKSFVGFELDTSPVKPRLEPIRIGKIQGGRQGERIYHPNGHSITLSSGGGGIGAKTGLYAIGGVVRRLHPRECARLTGLPDSFRLPRSDSQAYRQFGNSLVVDIVQKIIEHNFRGNLWSP
jgi:DNA (cytosine-5)-methyltransferase 1